MADTEIEWATKVWNPTTGCDRVSPGCDNCYALTMAKRLKGMGSAKYQRDGDPRTSGPGFGVSHHVDSLTIPLKWRKPQRIFVNSMSDLFHDQVPDKYIARVWAVMAVAEQHTFQVLTKRHARMRSLLSNPEFHSEVAYNVLALLTPAEDSGKPFGELPSQIADVIDWWPLRNIWLGVSTENQQWADIRIPALLDTPAAIRFVSAEPLLGSITLRDEWIGLADGYPDAPGERNLQSSRVGGFVDRSAGSDLAALGTQGSPGRFDTAVDPLQSAPGGELNRQVSSDTSDVRGQANSRNGASAGVAPLSRTDTRRFDGEPQERQARRQPARQSGIGDLRGADGACTTGAASWPAESVWSGEFHGEALDEPNPGDLLEAGRRGVVADPRGGVRSAGADDIEDCARRSTISWLIAGGESGPGARPMHPWWATSLHQQCEATGTAFLFKQWGAWTPLAPMKGRPVRLLQRHHDDRRPSREEARRPRALPRRSHFRPIPRDGGRLMSQLEVHPHA